MNEVHNEPYAHFYGTPSNQTEWYNAQWKSGPLSSSPYHDGFNSWNTSSNGQLGGTFNWGSTDDGWWSYDSRG